MPVAINQSDPRPGSANTVPTQQQQQSSNNNGASPTSSNNSNNSGNNNGTTPPINMNAAAPASGGPPALPTTTSRRGGRQRSRSPVTMGVGRGGGASPMVPPSSTTSTNNTGASTAAAAAAGGGGASGTSSNSNSDPAGGGGGGNSSGGDNPSSAAAAAAAVAAKAYSTGARGPGPGPLPWQEGQDEGGAYHGGGGYSDNRPSPNLGGSGGPPPPPGGNWPGEGPAPHPPPSHHPRGGMQHQQQQPYPGYDHRQFREEQPYHGGGGDRRYRGERYDRYGGGPPRGPPGYPTDYRSFARGPSLPPPHHHQQQQQHPHHYHHRRPRGDPMQQQQYLRGDPMLRRLPPPHPQQQQQLDPRGGPPNGQQPQQRGVTSLVLGGATPIHLPKSPVTSSKVQSESSTSSSTKTQKRGSAIFRGRPDDDKKSSSSKTPTREPTDEDSPSKILLSLRTPSTSFEDKKGDLLSKSSGSKKSSTEPSPAGPPPLQSPNGRSMDQLFERSPGESVKAAGSLDMTPSFNLFNQSFDSFGDAHYFNVDSTLQADSFGLGRVESVGGGGGGDAAAAAAAQQVIRKNSSGGAFAAQLLASNSGALNIGYSPVNSFGNASAAAAAGRRGGNMMVVGGQNAQSASPTEVLGMYRSYSGGGNVRPLDDSHFRMSAGSFGGPSMYGRPYGGEPSPNGYYMASVRSMEGGGPPFYFLLRKFKAAFQDCTFLLPGIKADASQPDQKDPNRVGSAGEDTGMKMMPGHPFHGGPLGMYGEPAPPDLAVARRRVESSVCAFGGNLKGGAPEIKDNKDAIFRGKDGKPDDHKSAGGASSSTKSTGAKKRRKYEEELPGRYYENESRLSWEFEEDPPVEVPPEEDSQIKESSSTKADDDASKGSKANPEDGQYCKSVGSDAGGDGGDNKSEGSSPQAKMRYRCKLCGQPKQNHRCPYQQSLARSIGTMVYPAVNAFTADEPGTIAAPLSEMNNFIDIKDSCSEGSPNRPTPERIRRMSSGPMVPSAQVTPESLRSNRGQSHSPSSFSATPMRGPGGRRGMSSSSKKRMYSQMKEGPTDNQGDLLFVDAMELKPEQFRIVSHLKTKKSSAPAPYSYPSLPLPYAQRKRLSDNLFSLSNEVPKLTDECAQVLREAREKDMWDLAVAELMTQVIVIIHCTDRDYRFEGLRQYLLTLGIAC